MYMWIPKDRLFLVVSRLFPSGFFSPKIGYFVLASEDVPKCSETCGTSGGQTLSQDCPKMAAAENKAASGTLLDG